jgi:hypothetical protein
MKRSEFISLCESIVEASTAMSTLKSSPGAKEVVQHLHQKRNLVHDVEFREIDKISWSTLKDSATGWILMTSPKGTAAIKATGGTYRVLVSDGSEIYGRDESRGGNAIDFIKNLIGKPTRFFQGTSDPHDLVFLQKKREQSQQKNTTGSIGSESDLMVKFKPLWVKLLTKAAADVRGVLMTMIKRRNYEDSREKINQLEKLETQIEDLEDGKIPESLKSKLNLALLMSAAYFYPEETGEITYNRYSYGGNQYRSERSEGLQRLMKDLAGRDNQKLAVILGFLKKAILQ